MPLTEQAQAKPTVTKNSSEFNRDAYASIPPGELVVFAVHVLQADGAPAATEDVVSICFRFFPHSFSLKNYFYWPDSALVSRRLHDAKEKGLLKGSAADGFEVKGTGKQTARQVAKALGVIFPAPPKVEVPVPPVEKKQEPPAPVKAHESAAVPQEKAKKKVELKKPAGKMPVKKPVAKKKTRAKKPVVKVAAPVKKKSALKAKKIAKPAAKPKTAAVKKVEKKGEGSRKKIQPTLKKKAKVEKPRAKKAESGKPSQPVMKPAAWKKAQAPATKPRVKKEAQPVKMEVLTPVAASKEEKDKAAKVVKQIERSDAYQLYRRSGKRASIGEFDFRNMLFATMESSAETLKRNVELFKRYAGIHFRADLIAFLEFCEENFSALLISKAKVKGKR